MIAGAILNFSLLLPVQLSLLILLFFMNSLSTVITLLDITIAPNLFFYSFLRPTTNAVAIIGRAITIEETIQKRSHGLIKKL